MAEAIFDEYGFLVRELNENEEGCRCHKDSASTKSATIESWNTVCRDWENTKSYTRSKVTNLMKRGGIPRHLRSFVWQMILNIDSMQKVDPTVEFESCAKQVHQRLSDYQASLQPSQSNIHKLMAAMEGMEGGEAKDKLEWVKAAKQIMLDAIRTFPDHNMFIGDTATKDSLVLILLMYVECNPAVGYCQAYCYAHVWPYLGMCYVAGLLLMNMGEKDAFWCLLSLLEGEKYLSGFYSRSLSRVRLNADIFFMMLRQRHCELANHLERLHIHPLMFVTSWFMGLFTCLCCWDTVLAIADMVFLDGAHTLLRAALAIMEVCSPELLVMPTADKVIFFLQHIPSRLVCHKNLVPVIWRTAVSEGDVEECQRLLEEQAGGNDQTPMKKKRKLSEGSLQAPPSTTKRILAKFLNVFTPSRPPFTFDGIAGTMEQAPPLRTCHMTVEAAGGDSPRVPAESEDYDVIGEPSSNNMATELNDIVTMATLKVGEDQVDSPCLKRRRVTRAGIPVHVTQACSPRRSARHMATMSPSFLSPLQEGVGKMKAAGPDAFKAFSTPVPTSKPMKRQRGDLPSPKDSDENDVEMKVLKRRKVGSPAT